MRVRDATKGKTKPTTTMRELKNQRLVRSHELSAPLKFQPTQGSEFTSLALESLK